jgi:hypothetical protein
MPAIFLNHYELPARSLELFYGPGGEGIALLRAQSLMNAGHQVRLLRQRGLPFARRVTPFDGTTILVIADELQRIGMSGDAEYQVYCKWLFERSDTAIYSTDGVEGYIIKPLSQPMRFLDFGKRPDPEPSVKYNGLMIGSLGSPIRDMARPIKNPVGRPRTKFKIICDGDTEDARPAAVKRGRGRPPGSRSRPRSRPLIEGPTRSGALIV